jgi:lipoyl synthase
MSHSDRLRVLPSCRSQKLNVLPQHSDTADEGQSVPLGRFPSWLHRRLPKGNQLRQTDQTLNEYRLHTVCEEAKCPNLFDCWSRRTATFLIGGTQCTRHCSFCDIDFAKHPQPLEEDEPVRVALSVQALQLRHVVITMVARDDLPDGGAKHLIRVMEAVRTYNPGISLEVLTSDFAGQREAWRIVIDAHPQIFNHNIETVRELTPRVRHRATYERTLELLSDVSSHKKFPDMKVKSGFMVGLGETEDQVRQTLQDLKRAGCEIITIGQYLQSNRHKLPVEAFIPPEQFKKYETFGYELKFSHMYCGPFVRSSYHADQFVDPHSAGHCHGQ